MKKRILAIILAALMVLPFAFSVFGAELKEYLATDSPWKDDAQKLSSMELVATSPDRNILLYLDRRSGEMGIKNLTTGDIAFSNPYDVGESNLFDREKPYVLSQIELNYTNVSTGETKTLHSYSDCVSLGSDDDPMNPRQVTFTLLENGHGIRVDYDLGKKAENFVLPNKITVADFDAVLAEMKDNMRPEIAESLGADATEEEIEAKLEIRYNDMVEYILANYKIYGNESKELGISKNKAEIGLQEYPISAKEHIYVIKITTSENQKKELAETLKKYTSYDLEKHEECYKKVEEKGIDDFGSQDEPSFKVSATYEVTNTGLLATVDASSLEYEKELYTVNTISILPYFNAAHASKNGVSGAAESDKGYTFIPDGSGALVRFEDLFNDNNRQVKFENAMYGNDYAYYQVKSKNAANMTMPVFGLSNHTANKGFFAIIEDGEALAIVTSNHTTAYHSIYAAFKITPSDVYDLADSFSSGASSSKEISIKSEQVYSGLCQVNYNMLTADETAEAAGITDYYENSYVGMANLYRDYLQEKGVISKLQNVNKDNVKLFLEAFGSIQVEEKILTFPVTVSKALTTFDDIKLMYADLKANGIGNTSFILKGFANGGLTSEYPTEIDWESSVGGEDGLEDLLKYAGENGFDVIPDIEFAYSYATGSFSGYSHSKNAVRTLDNRYTTKRNYYAATQTFERTGGVAVSSGSFAYLYDLFYEEMSQYNVGYLSVKSLGSDLNSDFDKEDYYDREASKDAVVEMLQLLKGSTGNKSYKLLMEAGNSYAMPYADSLLSVSLDSSRRSEMSESVPFFGIVFHGSIEFAGGSYNMEGDTEYAFLKAIENGATLYFTVAKNNVELLKFDSEYNKYYSVSYDNLKNTIISTYNKFNAVMKDVQDKYIVNHGFLDAIRTDDNTSVDSSLIVMVEYEGGIGFVLNYSSDEVVVTLPNGNEAVIEGFGFARYTK